MSEKSTKMTEKSLFAKYMEVLAVVVMYWIISIAMVFLNKHLLSSEAVGLNAPLFVTFYQCLCALVITLVLSLLSSVNPRLFTCPPLTLRLSTMRSVLPLSLMFVSMITFNNLCLKYVGVAFYFVGRSLTTVFNVVLTYAMLKQKTSLPAITSCLVIIFGFFLGVDQEAVGGTLSMAGVAYGVLASLFVSLNSIYTKTALPVVDDSVWLLTFYNNINAVLLFIPLMVITGEVDVLFNYTRILDVDFWNLMSLSGIFGFLIGYVTVLQVKVTSPLTHNISGTAKACTQTVLATFWYDEHKSPMWWLSNGLVLMGSAAYTRIKQLEMRRSYEEKALTAGGDDREGLLKSNV